MALSNSNHHSKIFVSATPYNVFKDDPSLEFPIITFKCNVKMGYRSDKPDKTIPSYIRQHDSWHEFLHPANDSARDSISSFLLDARIPFPLTNLHWKKHDYDKESTPLMSTDCLISSMLDVCNNTIDAARESGRKKLFMLVMIKKQVIVLHDEYLAMLKANQAQEVLRQAEGMIQLQAQGWNFGQSDWQSMVDAVRQAGLGNSIRNALDLAFERVTRESMEHAVIKLVPAAATSIQALEKVTSNASTSKEKCSVCMEEMVIGSQVTRLPCSHVFHGDCIVPWLNTSHMCPICRFKLPTT
ncbi:hypothetical protein V6N13_074474 [Hibiscus sabdariffa]|uniref:RING-type E3 ubiquitin transferase n=1 Tax=Hibiscus sabdariffa TaxID=183260 RepID=A0ABR2U8U7_9ROSI